MSGGRLGNNVAGMGSALVRLQRMRISLGNMANVNEGHDARRVNICRGERTTLPGVVKAARMSRRRRRKDDIREMVKVHSLNL